MSSSLCRVTPRGFSFRCLRSQRRRCSATLSRILPKELSGDSPAAASAVLPFVNTSGAPRMDYLSDGVTGPLVGEITPKVWMMDRARLGGTVKRERIGELTILTPSLRQTPIAK